MRWRQGRRSEHVEDRRGQGLPRRGLAVGGAGGLGLLLFVVVALLLGVDPTQLLVEAPSSSLPSGMPVEPRRPAADDELADFVSVVLADTEDTWHALFADAGIAYQEPTLVLFEDAVQSACGYASAAVGPFYCPADGRLFIDLDFYDELRNRFAAPGDFAQAYVIAHEVGHHVQNLLGISRQVEEARRRAGGAEGNALSVRMELQADCLAGVWAHHAQRTRNILESGDLEEALNAASAIGDDRIQRRTRGYVVPDSFTHGSAAQRSHWFRTGFGSGELAACDTFAIREP